MIIKCPKCGKDISDQGQICPYCMTPLNTMLQNNAYPVEYDNRSRIGLKIIGVLLMVVGLLGILMGLMMFGDIGIACLVGAAAALLSGIGFLIS